MEKVSRHFATEFAHGSISTTLTLEGERVDDLSDMVDCVQSVVSEQAYRKLIPHLGRLINSGGAIDDLHSSGSKTEETVVLNLLDYTFTIDIVLELNKKLKSPYKEMIGFAVVHTVASEVIADAAERLPKRLHRETELNYFREHPEDMPDPTFGVVDLGAFLGASPN